MATRKDPWKDWGKGIAGLLNSGQTFRAGQPGTVAMQNSPQAAFPNPGTYDPTFDINSENAQLGAFRYGQDFARDWGELGAGATGGRNAADLQGALGQLETRTGWNSEDLMQNLERGGQDLAQARTRGTEDYQHSIAGLLRNYGNLAQGQAARARQAGVTGGGTALASRMKREENQAIDRQPIDTNYNRFLTDNTTAADRLGRDTHIGLQRNNTQRDMQRGGIQQTYNRGREDAVTDAGRTNVDLQNYLGGQGRLAYYTSNQVQPAGVSILDLMKRRGTSR